MTLRTLLTLTLLAVATAAHAQQPPVSTWHGLRFGDTRDQVRAQLNAQHIPVETSQEGALQSTTDYDLFLPGLRYTLPLLSSYHFTDAGTLMDVTLTLDLAAMRHNWSSLGTDDAMTRFASEHLAGALAGRYGAPLYRSPACDADAKEPATCAYFWNGPDQSILLERSPSPHGPHLMLRYQMLATDL
jgi:hypothetical protein